MDSTSNIVSTITVFAKQHQEILTAELRRIDHDTWKLIKKRKRDMENRKRISFEVLKQSLNLHLVHGIQKVLSQSFPIRVRTIGRKNRLTQWWQNIVLLNYDEMQWLENFRMRRQTFFVLVNRLRESLESDENAFMPGLSVEEKVAVAIYRLASVSEYRCTGNLFGYHKSTICQWLHRFIKVLIYELSHELISFPKSRASCEEIAQSFEEKYGIPQVVGAIDGSYIPVTAPTEGAADFKCRKGYAALILQAVVDNRRLFRDVTVKHPGSNHDATVLVDSYLYQNIDTIMPQSDREYEGYVMPFVILGDPAYPLLEWLMVDYRQEETAEQISFNLRLNSARIVVEHAFGRLKARWRILCKKSDLDVYFMPEVVLACCILHNFVEKAKDPFLDQWQQFVNDVEYPPQRLRTQRHNRANRREALAVRERMSAYMSANYPLLTR